MSRSPDELRQRSEADPPLAAFTRALLQAETLRAIVLATERYVGIRDARVALLWSMQTRPAAPEQLRYAPHRAKTWADPALALRVLQAALPQHAPSAAGRVQQAWPLQLRVSAAAVLVIELPHGARAAAEQALGGVLAEVARRVADAIETRRLKSSVRRLERAERLQRALYAIADLSSSALERPEMMRQMHHIVDKLMYAENFFIVLYDAHRRTLRFAYFADVKDSFAYDPSQDIREQDVANSLTVALIHLGKPLMGTSVEICARLGLPQDTSRGPDSEAWLGVPMISGGVVRGAIVVQSYDRAVRYTESDQTLLGYVAEHILTALTRRQAQEELEQQVQLRTHELAQANRDLVAEVDEREAGERLQAALFQIAEVSTSSVNMDEFYAAVHAVIGKLLYARNFFVALLVDDGNAFEFPYVIDELDPKAVYERRSRRRGLSEYVLRLGKPLRVLGSMINDLVAAGEVEHIGSLAVCWLGVPLVLDGRIAGVLAVQSYTPGVVYSARDEELLTFVSLHVATALQRWRAQESLKAAYAELQGRVDELRRTQNELIENEKMASLGRLVAGVAHEINTPMGIGVTAASHLDSIFASIDGMLGEPERPELRAALANARRCVELVLSNLGKADHLIKSFKQVAVDQSNEDRRWVAVRSYLEDVLASLAPALKGRRHRIELDCAPELGADTYPGAIYQIVSNLVLNALMHAFDTDVPGHLRVAVYRIDDVLEMTFADDGKGMPEDVRLKVFEPFFTTRRGSGGTGLGLHLVYNLVTQLLRGTIECQSAPGRGTRFVIRLPAGRRDAP